MGKTTPKVPFFKDSGRCPKILDYRLYSRLYRLNEIPQNKFMRQSYFSSLKAGPNTAQKGQRFALLGVKSFAPRFNFFSLSVLSKTIKNENFD